MCFYKQFVIFISILVFSGCQSTDISWNKSFKLQNNLYLDEVFLNDKNIEIESESDVFAIDEDMRTMVKTKLLTIKDPKRRAKKLLSHIFSKGNINLAYRSNANLTAIQTYHTQTANCMSLTIMAYVLAKEANLDIKFQDVKVPEYWVRNDQYNMLTGHVNLLVNDLKESYKSVVYRDEFIEIDFDPLIMKKSFPKKIIGQNTVLAMFYNNKGAQALVANNYNLSYVYLKKATLVDPNFSPAWGNIGVLYRKNGNIDTSKLAYQHAIALDKSNLTTLRNYSFLLRRIGENEEAKSIETMLRDKRNRNPYYHALLGDEALYRDEYDAALKHYKKAIRMDDNVHEFYFGLAKVYFELKNISKAEKYMKKALVHNKASAIENQYIAKLNYIRRTPM